MQQPDTSVEAFELKSSESLKTDYGKIISALRVLKVANYDEIACFNNWPDKNAVSRRMKELETCDPPIVVKTGVKTKTSRNRNAYQYTLLTPTTKYTLPEKVVKGQTSAADFANLIIAKTTQKKLF